MPRLAHGHPVQCSACGWGYTPYPWHYIIMFGLRVGLYPLPLALYYYMFLNGVGALSGSFRVIIPWGLAKVESPKL